MYYVTTVGDLRQLLANVSDDTPLEVAATPDANGWTTWILSCVHRDDERVVLALSAEAATPDERTLVFRDADGNTVRPV